jgi:hypothetical protein
MTHSRYLPSIKCGIWCRANDTDFDRLSGSDGPLFAKKTFFCYSARSDREGLHGEAQEACGDLRASRKKQSTPKRRSAAKRRTSTKRRTSAKRRPAPKRRATARRVSAAKRKPPRKRGAAHTPIAPQETTPEDTMGGSPPPQDTVATDEAQ